MLGGIVIALFAVIYALVIRKVSADAKAATMELLASRRELHDRGDKDLVAAEAALTGGEASQFYANVIALEADKASVDQYELGEKMLREAVDGIERSRDQILGVLAPFMEGENPRIAFTGPRSRKLKLVDDSYLTDEEKGRVLRRIREYNRTLAVSPRREFHESFAQVPVVDEAGRAAELFGEIPPDREAPVLDMAVLEDALNLPVPGGFRSRRRQGREVSRKKESFRRTTLYAQARALSEKAHALRAAQNGGEGRGRGV
ncbi:hypothetical protein LG943_05655 [Streptomonospora sp. S1-112]|uniref:Uncharacterized protein n=1 Tax=Streptomonospora mangrovi TaxID=2883123 RepID=A0A9X3NIR2_9ACTN|nr:hypothetical protein [Streptomonospora mangrovi]MDA0563815.1 hypothetical protein [Streptomonospora mangrovi]